MKHLIILMAVWIIIQGERINFDNVKDYYESSSVSNYSDKGVVTTYQIVIEFINRDSQCLSFNMKKSRDAEIARIDKLLGAK